MKQIKEWKGADRETLESQIVPSKEPAVIRSLVRDWYCVSDCPDSRDRCAYIESLDADVPVYTIAAPPDAGGRFFYNDDLKGLNFKSGQIPLPQILGQLLAQIDDSDAHSIAVQSLPVREVLPNFEKQNPMPLLDPEIAPTMWIGNRGKVAPHYDVHRNIACVVDGSRRFTVFPPDQVANLYPGPILGAPGGDATAGTAGSGANIDINAGDGGGESGGSASGDGGNVTIDADLILAFPQENSDIKADAFEGDGGNINIDALSTKFRYVWEPSVFYKRLHSPGRGMFPK